MWPLCILFEDKSCHILAHSVFHTTDSCLPFKRINGRLLSFSYLPYYSRNFVVSHISEHFLHPMQHTNPFNRNRKTSRHSLNSMNFVVSPLSGHFTISRDFFLMSLTLSVFRPFNFEAKCVVSCGIRTYFDANG